MTAAAAPQKRKWPRILLGIGVSVAALVVVFSIADLDQVVASLQNANYVYLPLAALAFFLTMLFRSLAWQTLLKGQVRLDRLYFTVNVGYLLNNLFPFRAGEIGRCILLSQAGNLSFWEVASTIMLERTFDLLIVACLLLSSLPFAIAAASPGMSATWAEPFAFTTGAIVLLGLVSLYFIARHRIAITAWLEKISARWPRLESILTGRLESFLDGLGALTDAKRFVMVVGAMAICWVFAVLEAYFVMKIFIDQVAWIWIIFACGVASLGVAVPSSPGGIGVLEASYVGALAVFGIPTSIALAFALVAHALYYVLTTILGVIGLLREGETLGHIYERIVHR